MADSTADSTLGLDRRELLKRAVAGGGLVAAAVTAPGLAGVAKASGGKSVVLDVDTDGFDDFDFSGSDGGAPGPFYVSGQINAPGASNTFGTEPIGSFHCWGWIRPDGLPVVNQEFAIDDRGKILIAGVESDAPRAVTGGTGDFAGARGEGVPDLETFDFGNTGKFRIWFSLTGASGPAIT